jgi:hypothetical protein
MIEHAVHGLALVDLKTMRSASRTGQHGATPKPYRSWCYQLAAYRQALGQPVKCINLMVSSVEPSEPIEHVWSEVELEQGWQAFEAARRLWVIEKAYDPSQGIQKAEGRRMNGELPEAA